MRYAIAALALLGMSAPAMAAQTIHITGSFDGATGWGVPGPLTNSDFDLTLVSPSAIIIGSLASFNVSGSIGGIQIDPSRVLSQISGFSPLSGASFFLLYRDIRGPVYDIDFNIEFKPINTDEVWPDNDYFSISNFDHGYLDVTTYFSWDDPYRTGFTRYTDVSMNFVEATGTPPAGVVPEPATWATMLLGFGLAGAALRRRRSVEIA